MKYQIQSKNNIIQFVKYRSINEIQMFYKIFTILFLLYLINTDCPITHYPKRVTIGYVHAQINEEPSRHGTIQSYVQPLVQPLLQNKFQAVIAVNGFQTWTGGIFDFDIQVYKEDNNNVKFEVIVKDLKYRWKSLKFNYLISESSYFHMDVSSATQLMMTPIPYTYRHIQPIKSDFPITSKTVAQVFICGLHAVEKQSVQSNYDIPGMIQKLERLKNYAWNVQLINKFKKILLDQTFPSVNVQRIQVKKGLLTFNVRTSNRVMIKKFTFSYLLFSEKEDKKYEYISGDFISSSNSLYFFDALQHDGMLLLGMTGLKYEGDSPFSLDVTQGNDEIKNQLFYHSFVQTTQNQFWMSYFGIHLIKGLQCIDCPSSSYIFQNFCVSQCPFGYVVERNQYLSYVCVECQITRLFVPRDGKCECAEGYYLVSPSRSCNPCPYDCLTCQGSTCLTCDNKYFQSKRLLNNGRCQCPQIGYYDDAVSKDRICKTCHYTCQACFGQNIHQCLSCRRGRQMSKGNLCVCLNNYFENSQGNCVCTPPSKVQNGICVHNPTSCGENEYIVNQGIYKKCECKPGTFRLKDKCIACGENQQFDYGLQKCVCNQGTVQDGENCYKCRENQTFNIAYKTCDCIFGYQKNKEGDCIVCPALTFYDEDTDACECIFNYYKVGSQCLRCTNPNQGPKCYVIEYSDDQFFT